MRHPAITLISFGFGLAAAAPAVAQNRELGSAGELLDGVAALVDTGLVLKSEVRERMQIVSDNFTQTMMELPPSERGQLPPVAILEQQVLDQLILEEIQVQRARTVGIEIGDNDLNQVLAELASRAGMTLTDLPAFIEAQGISYSSFREDQRRELSIRALERAEVVQRIAINPRELEQCVERSVATQTDDFEYNVSHILIGFPPDGPAEVIDEAEARIRDIGRQLDEGADFAQLAVAYSEAQTALEGGSLGWRRGAELPTQLAPDVLTLAVGEHSTPIRSAGAFHIVRLNDMRGTEPTLVDQVRARHILLTPTEVLDNDATEQKLRGIRQQILDGDDFATTAAAVSEDTGSAVDGGDLGWMMPDDFDPAFSAMLESLEPGELSEPFRTSFGWHIAELTDTRSYDMTEDLREQNCRQQIGNRMVTEESEIWRRRMRDQAYVQKRI
jgi:peptidyl-prolyl cis-trans isomerase SurA